MSYEKDKEYLDELKSGAACLRASAQTASLFALPWLQREAAKQREEYEVTLEGGRHSKVDEAFELIPAGALEAICKVLAEGAAKYEPVTLENSLAANWRKIPRRLHIRHAGIHLLKLLQGKDIEENLSHAACRLLFALETV